MSAFTWDNPEMKLCGECIFKDDDPRLCHAVEPPLTKPFIPDGTSSCFFVRKSYWDRIPEKQKAEIIQEVANRSLRYYKSKELK